MKRAFAILVVLTVLVTTALCFAVPAHAQALDEILLYEITVDVNQDGTLYMVYHIDWKVLDSTQEGVTYMRIGIPNSHCESYSAHTSNIRNITYDASGGSFIRLDLDREYLKDEVITVEFDIVQDYLYEMNYKTEGETHYEFTPGWFDDIAVDRINVKWNSDRALNAQPSHIENGGYYVWSGSLEPGKTFTVSVDYPNDAFNFSESTRIQNGNSGGSGSPLVGLIILAVIGLAVFFVIKSIRNAVYNSTANMGGGEAKKKITREKIVYYPECPGCGAPRPEGKDNCDYCGKSLIKSKETVTEEQIPEDMKQKTADGTYRFGADPNTFMRVHVVPIPVRSPLMSRSYVPHGGTGARSSCACASHCACACACACAGGGRAGCSAKDFYNTDLKLENLKRKK